MTTSVSPILDKIQDTFKTLIWDTAVKAQLSALIGTGLGLTILSPIITYFTDKLYGAISKFIDISAIRLKNESHQSKYDNLSVRMRIVAQEKGVESDEYKKTVADAKAAYANFVGYNF